MSYYFPLAYRGTPPLASSKAICNWKRTLETKPHIPDRKGTVESRRDCPGASRVFGEPWRPNSPRRTRASGELVDIAKVHRR